jgi:hypothetical protein
MCSEEHQIAIFLSDVINEEMKENEVGRACRYHKCAIKLHTHNDSYNTWIDKITQHVIKTAYRTETQFDEVQRIHPLLQCVSQSAGNYS